MVRGREGGREGEGGRCIITCSAPVVVLIYWAQGKIAGFRFSIHQTIKTFVSSGYRESKLL
jgi:hypothetical protein